MTVALVAFLAEYGITVQQSGELIAMAILPWTFKLLWAPLIDTVNYPAMGRRRPWILFAQLMMAITLITMATSGNLTSDLTYFFCESRLFQRKTIRFCILINTCGLIACK